MAFKEILPLTYDTCTSVKQLQENLVALFKEEYKKKQQVLIYLFPSPSSLVHFFFNIGSRTCQKIGFIKIAKR
jgi:hypothetical protein